MTQQDKTTAQEIKAGRKAILLPGVEATGTPARIITGPAGARHHLETVRAESRKPRRAGSQRSYRLAMRRTGRQA